MRIEVVFVRVVLVLIVGVMSGCKWPSANEVRMSVPGSDASVSIPTLVTARGGNFFANGFPTNFRRSDDGTIDMRDFPRQYHWMTRRYLDTLSRNAHGYHTVMPIYFPLTQPVDLKSMSHWDADYVSSDAPVQVVDIDPASPEYGRRFPLSLTITHYPDQYRPAHLLQIFPTMGFTLRPNTTYAALVMDSVPLQALDYWKQNEQLTGLLAVRDPAVVMSDEARETFAPLRNFIAAESINADAIMAATVWTTGDPLAVFARASVAVAEKAETLPELPVSGVENIEDFPEFCAIRGYVDVPGYQKGRVPFLLSGGSIDYGADGAPVEQYSRNTKFVVTIPKHTAMPAAGFPLLSYVHGAAGSAQQVYERGDFDHYDLTRYPYYIAKNGEGPSQIAAERGWASSGFAGHLSVDHLPSWDVLTIPLMFNAYNPDVFGTNYQVITWEAIYFRRILERLTIDASLCPDADPGPGNTAFRFDTDTEVSMGQSLGVWGAAFKVSMDPKPYKGLIVGGAGGTWTSVISKNLINKLAYTMSVINQLPFQNLDDAHPFLMIAEWAFGAEDLSVQMEKMMKYPEKSPPHILGISGFNDEIFPDPAQRSAFISMGTDLVGEDVGQGGNNGFMPYLQVAGLQQLEYPVSDNYDAPGYGTRTNVVLRYPGKNPALLYSGHEVMFEDAIIKHQYGCFLEDIARGQSPVIIMGNAQGDPCS